METMMILVRQILQMFLLAGLGYLLFRGKKITATDERYFKQAEEALYTELGFALEKTNEEIRALINSTMEQKKKALAQA